MVLPFSSRIIMSPKNIGVVDKYEWNIVIFLLEVNYGYKGSIVGHFGTQ